MKVSHILEARYHSDDNIELTQAPREPGDKKKAFDRMVNEKWADGVLYRGENIYKIVYEDGPEGSLASFLEKQLTEQIKETNDIHSLEMQESYLGYVPEMDFFVLGFDTWAEVKNDDYDWREDEDEDNGLEGYEEYYREDVENMMIFVIEKGGPEDWRMMDIQAGMMYPKGINALHAKYPSTVDVRLD